MEDLAKYKLESEFFSLSPETATKINKAIQSKKKVCAIGIETMRVIEECMVYREKVKPKSGWISKFLFPPQTTKVCNSLISTFCQPSSLSLIINSSFTGYNLMERIYSIAQEKRYRFLDYGDSMIVL